MACVQNEIQGLVEQQTNVDSPTKIHWQTQS